MVAPHNGLAKEVMGVPEHATSLLRWMLPSEVARRLDWPTLTVIPTGFIETDLADTACDLLYEVQTDHGRPALVYVLVEHQSSNDSLMPFRMLRYCVEAWRRWLRDNQGHARLPPVIPVVVSHAPEGWRSPESLQDMLDVTPELLEPLRAHLPSIRPLVEDLSARSDQELRNQALTAHVMLGLLLLKNARSAGDLLERLAGWIDLFRQIVEAPHGIHLAAVIARYILVVSRRVEERDLVRLLTSPDPTGARLEEAVMTAADRLRAEGIEQGIERGIEQGIEQGDLLGRRDLLLRQMSFKFRQISQAVRDKVLNADRASLDKWSERILTAATAEEVVDG